MKSILKIAIFCLLALAVAVGIAVDIAPSQASSPSQIADARPTYPKKLDKSSRTALNMDQFTITSIYIPMFYRASDLYASGLMMTNLEATDATITVTGYQENGDQAFTINDTIAGNDSITYFLDPRMPDGFVGSLVISSDKAISANVTTASLDFTTNTNYSGRQEGSNTLLLPLLQNNTGGFTSVYSIQNAGSAPANVIVEYSDGISVEATIPIGAAKYFYQNEEGHGTGLTFSAKVTSDQPVVAAVLISNISILYSYTGFTYEDSTTTPHFPMVVQNPSDYLTGIPIYNAGDQTTDVTVEYIPNQVGETCQETISIEADASVTFSYFAFVFDFDISNDHNCELGSAFIGSARVVSNSTAQPLIGLTSLFVIDVNGDMYRSFSPTEGSDTVLLPVISDRMSGFNTTMAIQHVAGPPSDIICTFSNTVYFIIDNLEPGHSLIASLENNISDSYIGSGTCQATNSTTQIVGVVHQVNTTASTDLSAIFEGINIGSSVPPISSYDCSTVSQIPQSECEALIAIYESTGGPNWHDNTRWLTNNSPCGWYGVGCDSGSVTMLNFGSEGLGNGLVGSLPPEIGNLSNLAHLDLWANQLTSLPDEICTFSNLIYLDLDQNGLQSLPTCIGDLSSLAILYLSNNQFNSIPDSLGDLVNLYVLHLSYSQLSTIPDTIFALTRLFELALSHNQLSSIPPEILELSNLEYLYLNGNQLSCIPPEIGGLSYLIGLNISYNHIMTANPALLNFLNTTDPDWAATQTVGTPGSEMDSRPLYFSSSTGGRAGNTAFADEDILVFDQCTNTWSLYFDGSDVGLQSSDLNAFHVLNSGQILFSLTAPKTLNGVRYDDSDIIRFKPTSLGRRTRGDFFMYLDGSDVQLTKSGEDIDAIARLSNGDLVISTLGTAKAGGVTARDEDLLRFHKKRLGNNTEGTWSLYMDGSDIKLTNKFEDVWAAWVDTQNDDVYLSTYKNYSAASSGTSQSGDSDDIFTCSPTSIGGNTRCQLSLYWNGDDSGFGSEWIDGHSVGPVPPDTFAGFVSSAATDDEAQEEEVDPNDGQDDDVLDDDEYTEQVYLPLINR